MIFKPPPPTHTHDPGSWVFGLAMCSGRLFGTSPMSCSTRHFKALGSWNGSFGRRFICGVSGGGGGGTCKPSMGYAMSGGRGDDYTQILPSAPFLDFEMNINDVAGWCSVCMWWLCGAPTWWIPALPPHPRFALIMSEIMVGISFVCVDALRPDQQLFMDVYCLSESNQLSMSIHSAFGESRTSDQSNPSLTLYL